MELYRKGASTPAIIAFLLAAPWANLAITIILFGFFGLKAILFIASALAIAIITGLIYLNLDMRGLIECSNHPVSSHSKPNMVKCKTMRPKGLGKCNHLVYFRGFKNAFNGILRGSWELSRMILWWMIIGMMLASLTRTYIPREFFINFMGPNII